MTPSATPPVECLSTVGRVLSVPVEAQRLARVDHRLREGEGLVVVQAAEQGRHQERGGERIGDLPRRVSLDECANVFGRQSLAVPLRGHDRPRILHARAPIHGTGRAAVEPSLSWRSMRSSSELTVDPGNHRGRHQLGPLDPQEVDEARPFEAHAVRSEELGHRLPQVRERVPRPDVVRPSMQPRGQQRRPLARMVGRWCGRIAPVVTRDQQHAAVEGADQLRQPPVERLDRRPRIRAGRSDGRTWSRSPRGS